MKIHKPRACRAVKKFSSSRLIVKSRRLWNSHQRYKFLMAEASRDILKFRVPEIAFPGIYKRYFPPGGAMLFGQNTHKTGNNAVKMSQAFHNITRFECFTRGVNRGMQIRRSVVLLGPIRRSDLIFVQIQICVT